MIECIGWIYKWIDLISNWILKELILTYEYQPVFSHFSYNVSNKVIAVSSKETNHTREKNEKFTAFQEKVELYYLPYAQYCTLHILSSIVVYSWI